MPIPSSLTINYDALLSTTLFNYHKTIEDQISTSNIVFYYLTKKEEDGYVGVSDLGDRCQIALMYELGGAADTYFGYDTLPTSPTDGVTSAFFDWRQMAIPISISRLEERKNSGEAKMKDLLKTKVKQATLGIQEFWAKVFLQGLGVTSTSAAITSPYQSPSNSSYGIDPLPFLIAKDPTASVSVGNINQSTYSWWRNQFKSSAAANFSTFRKHLRTLKNNCGKGPGGTPNVYLSDQATAEFYEEVLAASHRNPSYEKADIPFEAVNMFGRPLVWDEFMPNWQAGTTVQATNQGTIVALNTKFIQIKYDKETNFISTDFKKPVDQDAKVAHIMWLGAAGLMNRRKQGVMFNIDTTITS